MRQCKFIIRCVKCDYEEPDKYTENCDFEGNDSGIVCSNCGGEMYYCLE
ncbi:hypothetical protein MBCUT_05890 [Methanobrevibacter cuticularis]|uniref:Uncharacterized protein n=1 Tax=Methanobrevibacter cuticularis TaxID=47311 RepID=A0A166EJK1_9EURY|nr:hypothetical protein [Methanobrevibacter cuticularis]KZX16725.1 hypothetical protein MBCUT_05890 [Methanobrevibacter cuticularis]